jgi:UDP-N-acetylglucosamine:LPS N-acetylglucosamine transferase
MRILVAMGEGGHTKEVVTLIDMLGGGIAYGYLLVDDDLVSAAKIRREGPVYRVRRPRDKAHRFLRDASRTIQCGWQSLRVLRTFKPDAVLSTGPSVAVPVSLLARALGKRVIFVETGSRVTALSATGRIMYKVADLFFVQWPELLAAYPRAVYAGRLF